MTNRTYTLTTSMESFKRYLAKLLGKLDLRSILITPFVIQILLTLGLIGYLSFSRGQPITNNAIVLSALLLNSVMTGVIALIAYYRLVEPVQEVEIATETLAKEKLQEQPSLESSMLRINSTASLPAPAHRLSITSAPPPAAYQGMIDGDQYYSFLKKESNSLYHILVVANDTTTLQIIKDNLISHYYKVTLARTSNEALELIDSNQNIHLVLLDFIMPQISGIELCREIRHTHSANHLPIIMLATNNQRVDLSLAFNVGVNDYITTPFSREELLSRIKSHLRLAQLANAYHRFVPDELLSCLGKNKVTEIELGDQVSKKMGVLFADIRSFGRLSKQMTSQENFHFLNAYLARIRPIISEYNGFINQYMGDRAMVLFSGPASDAVDGAIAMQRTIRHYNTHRAKSSYEPIRLGIGLHYGEVMIGAIGEEQQIQSTVISPVVNFAARLEELTKLYGTSILVSQQTIDALKNPQRYHFRFLDKIKLKGKEQTMGIFEVLEGDAEEIMQQKIQTLAEFETALAYYYQKDFAKAQTAFQHVLSINPADHVARLYHQRVLGLAGMRRF